MRSTLPGNDHGLLVHTSEDMRQPHSYGLTKGSFRLRSGGESMRTQLAAAETSTLTEAVTSGCRRTVTACLPSDLICTPTSTVRRSMLGPPALRIAPTTSAGVSEPNSL